jgi:hypothetical protein
VSKKRNRGPRPGQWKGAVKPMYFDLITRTPSGWIVQSAELMLASELLIEASKDKRRAQSAPQQLGQAEPLLDSRMAAIYRMLVAFATENILKATLVAKIDTIVTEIPTIIQSHKLVELVNRCGHRLPSGDTALLGQLTEYAEWRGRYPSPTAPSAVPISDDRFAPQQTPPLLPAERDQINKLITTLFEPLRGTSYEIGERVVRQNIAHVTQQIASATATPPPATRPDSTPQT